MAREPLLDYTDFNEEFKIHINARNLQLGAIISQNGKLIALHIRKLTGDQKRYTVTEKDMLSIIETLK